MKACTSGIDERLLLAPSRLVTDYPIRNGYEMGIAVTAGSLGSTFPISLSDAELDAVERVFTTVEQRHSAYCWHPVLTEEEFIARLKTARERLREKQERFKKIRQAVKEGDIWLPALIRHSLVLTVTTRKGEFAPVPASVTPKYPFAAVVEIQVVE
jgi:hypothetical protein